VSVSRCPVGHRCESCGSNATDLTVVVVPTALGSICLTSCTTCLQAFQRGAAPPITVDTATRLVEQHIQHTIYDPREAA